MNTYRYQLEKYRGRSTRYSCPQCGRKYCFTRYIDTETNQYINERVGKCNRLDKCGYHYTPHQYFTDNPWKRDAQPREDGVSFFRFYREKEKKKIESPTPTGYIPKRVSAGLPRRVLDASMREFSSLFAGHKNVTHDVGELYPSLCYREESQNHKITRGGGYVISVIFCISQEKYRPIFYFL